MAGRSLGDKVLNCLRESRRPLRAAEIARILGVTRNEINKVLYGPLFELVVQDSSYRWHLKSDGSLDLFRGMARPSFEPTKKQKLALIRRLNEFDFSPRVSSAFRKLRLRYVGDLVQLGLVDKGYP